MSLLSKHFWLSGTSCFYLGKVAFFPKLSAPIKNIISLSKQLHGGGKNKALKIRSQALKHIPITQQKKKQKSLCSRLLLCYSGQIFLTVLMRSKSRAGFLIIRPVCLCCVTVVRNSTIEICKTKFRQSEGREGGIKKKV